ncbi:hypothetical protein DPMN_006460 [Dreissena polymorpha]|uniref:Uncharacterized protein n=1 Tax=Dreissena polymorpha TaxID=45954 RepID=A0A9D4MUL6_DREPO|nr:hypothetical protein DPMN_006460 [Dreissena polymorpha]
MRENLLFYGLRENQQENCEQLIKQVISQRLEIVDNIIFDRVHRLGKPHLDKSRSIVAKFHYYTQREQVRTTATTQFDILKNAGIGIGVQQTKTVLTKRRQMSDVFNLKISRKTGKMGSFPTHGTE